MRAHSCWYSQLGVDGGKGKEVEGYTTEYKVMWSAGGFCRLPRLSDEGTLVAPSTYVFPRLLLSGDLFSFQHHS